MQLIPNKGVPSVTLTELVTAGVAKVVTERFLAMTPVGNDTFMSGALKIAGAYGVNTFLGQSNILTKSVYIGMMVDGTEDIARNLMRLAGLMDAPASNNNSTNDGLTLSSAGGNVTTIQYPAGMFA